MKRLIIIFVILTSALQAEAQYRRNRAPQLDKFNLEIGLSGTRAIGGYKGGYSISLHLKERWTFNYSMVTDLGFETTIRKKAQMANITYWVNPKSRFQIGGTLKGVLHDNSYVAFVPLVDTRYEITKVISAGLAVAFYDGYPAFEAKLGVSLFKK